MFINNPSNRFMKFHMMPLNSLINVWTGLLFYQSIWIFINAKCRCIKDIFHSNSTRHLSPDICPPISKIVLKNFIKISLIIKECPDEILIKLAIVLKISKSSWNTVSLLSIYLWRLGEKPMNPVQIFEFWCGLICFH
jgi:hypothetical protein